MPAVDLESGGAYPYKMSYELITINKNSYLLHCIRISFMDVEAESVRFGSRISFSG